MMIRGCLLVTVGELSPHMICVGGRSKPAVLQTCSTKHRLSQCSLLLCSLRSLGSVKTRPFFPLCLLLLCVLCSGTVSIFAHLTPCPLGTWGGWDICSLDWVSPGAQAGHPQQRQPCSEMGEETHWVLHHPGRAARVALSSVGGRGNVRITGSKGHHSWPWWGPGVPARH